MVIGIQKPETFGDPVKMDRATSLESLTHVEKRRRMMANRASPTGDSGSYTSPGRAAAATPGDSGSHASPVQTLDYLKNIDPKLLGKIEKLARKEHVDPEKQVTIWDFGGQDVYYTTHQTFLSEHIIYLLVFRLDVDLDEKIPVYRGEKTVKEFIMFWLNSIHMHTVERLREEDRDVIPYVLIIGTHKDMLGPQVNVKDIFGKLMECLDDKQALKAHVYEYIAINNLAESDAEFDEIKSVIEKLCGYSSGTEASVHKFSVSSIQLEMDLAKKSEESPIITVDELCKMAQRVGLSDEELRNSFIPYHHHQGDILHFKVDGLENVVIIDPLWLADVFSAIMTPCISEDECSHIGLQKAGLKKGVLQEEVFDECLEENSMTERKADIIRLMLHFDLMLEISQSVENPLPGPGKRTFLVPSMLVSNKCENNAISEKDPEKCLLIAFPHILFPTGLFHQLTTRLLRKYKPLDYENNIPVVGFDRASFFLDKQSVLHLAIEENAMKMTITDAHTGSQTKPHIYSNARKTVEKELSALRDAYCPRMQLQFRIRVKVGDKDIPIDAEDVQKNDVIYKCIEGSEKPIDMTPYRVWFSEANVPDASISAQKFARLHYLVTELGTKAIRTFFLKDVVRPDLTNANHVSDKDAVIRFFSKHETKLKEAKKCMNASQLNLLNSASGQADVERFDITLLVLLLSKFQPDKDNLDWITPDQNATLPFPPQTTQDFVYHILRLKKVRNYLSHSPKYGVQDNAEFCTNRDIAYASILALGADPKEVEKTQKIMFTVEEIDSV
ncbi:uncharacterized protein LOC106167484 isoform X2 [Lingula anatina]|uniref:Uncharacterized protein LOC106167484 isoform X2 n=1 Tax=Lingula anatina TaxID=7574 RepID=A0A2R2MPQ1_LINAN|nr:uncharacterized protein LOC106167484 isoform X2 [Lingula anatina]|eukprot:XP_023932214.1 uncharacterized protein LOC106167484 isoform X2 [Lingula anatina]